MKKRLLLMTFLAAAFAFTACSDDDDEGGGSKGETMMVSLSVSNIANNSATVSASLTQGDFHGAKIVEAVMSDAVTGDYSNQADLIAYVEANGFDVELPYTNTVTGLRPGTEMLSAVIAYDSNGEVGATSYKIWTAEGDPVIWSDDNDAGSLDEVDWPEPDEGDGDEGGDEGGDEDTSIDLGDGNGAGKIGEIEWPETDKDAPIDLGDGNGAGEFGEIVW